MNKQLTEKVKQTLRNHGVKVWFFETDRFGKEVEERTFLSFSDLSDKELGSLFSSVNWGTKNGLLWIREDRNKSLSWECTNR